MSWHKITRPLTMEIDPEVVRIGEIVWDCYVKENKPEGFAMFHATRGSEGELDDKFLVYLSPVAHELCHEELAKDYQLEPCGVPARDEPNAAFVFGDPRAMSLLKEYFEPEPGTVEWQSAQAAAAAQAEAQAQWEAAQAAAAQAGEAKEESPVQAESESIQTDSESAQAGTARA